jgi:hypothetical protein
MSYYKANASLLYHLRGDFDCHFTLTDLENMIPFERSAYLILIKQKTEKHNQEKKNRKRKR